MVASVACISSGVAKSASRSAGKSAAMAPGARNTGGALANSGGKISDQAAQDPVLSRSTRWLWSAIAVLIVLPGLMQFLSGKRVDGPVPLTSSDAQELVERHLAHWLAKRTAEEGAVVFTPPLETTTLCFFGGLRGVGTLVPENRAGFGVTLMITAASTIDEDLTLLQARGVRYIVVPSWDSFFDEFAHLYLQKSFSERKSPFIGTLPVASTVNDVCWSASMHHRIVLN